MQCKALDSSKVLLVQLWSSTRCATPHLLQDLLHQPCFLLLVGLVPPQDLPDGHSILQLGVEHDASQWCTHAQAGRGAHCQEPLPVRAASLCCMEAGSWTAIWFSGQLIT